MLPSLRHRFDRLERQRTGLLARLAALGADELAFRAGEGRWSALEVVEHLVRADEGTVRQLDRRDAPPPSLASRARSTVMFAIVRAVLGRVRLKVPARGLLPSGEATTLADLARRWGESRCRMANYLDSVTPEQLGMPLFRHPVAGWLTLSQGLDFHQRHVATHERQLERIRRRVG